MRWRTPRRLLPPAGDGQSAGPPSRERYGQIFSVRDRSLSVEVIRTVITDTRSDSIMEALDSVKECLYERDVNRNHLAQFAF
jgi:hypothetical protein